MALFQQSVLKKYLNNLNKEQVQKSWQQFQSHFHNSTIQEHIRNSKEEEYQEGFVRDLFVSVLGYTLKPQPDFNFVLEQKSTTDATKSDGAVLKNAIVLAVIELKDTYTSDLGKVEKQAFGYKHQHKGCHYIITSNFEKLRFYINDATEHIEFNLFELNENEFKVLYACLQYEQILNDMPLKMQQASVTEEESVTKKLYADYSKFKKELFANITAQNPQYNKLELFKKTQKLLDRLLFILFAEDSLLVPTNSVREILKQWEQLKELDNYVPLYERLKKYFGYLDKGHEGKQYEIYAYNGGLFAADEVLENIQIDDGLLYKGCKVLSDYDFESEVDVNILGHIFEHSLSEIEEVQAELEGRTVEKAKTKRKKDGVFYTPRYITKYIVENTVGELCRQQKEELKITDDEFEYKKRKDARGAKLKRLDNYRQWLLSLTICDPACGSGAFLNQALEFLIAEHKYIDELRAKLLGERLVMSDMETEILQHNLFGVDINEEAVEIARLSLWLRTAQKGRKLSDLSQNIKCGNSLIDDPEVAGEKAFNWRKEFPQVFGKYAEKESLEEKEEKEETQRPEYNYIPEEAERSARYPPEKITNQNFRITNSDERDDYSGVNELAVAYGLKRKSEKGFDVVIGNPPYVDIKALQANITDYIFENFKSSNNRINLFSVFIERSLGILKSKSLFSFIIPSALLTQESYQKLRGLILNNTRVCSIVRLPNESFGGSAGEVKVDTIILTFEKNGAINDNIDIIIYKGFDRINEISPLNAGEYNKIQQSEWTNDSSKVFRINVNVTVSKLLAKIENNTEKLINCADFSLGLTPYDKYKGHTPEQIKNRVFHSAFKKDETYKKLLAGNDVRRYFVAWGGEEWISYGSWLGAPREQRFFTQKRILVKQIIDWTDKRIWAAMTDEELYNTQNAFNLIANPAYKTEYLLTIINSNLLSFYLSKKFLEEFKDRFQKILIKDCKEFPIKLISESEQLIFVDKVNTILSKIKELQEIKKKLSNFLIHKFENISINKKLQEWPLLNSNEFLKELQKQKTKLSLEEETEWIEYFEGQKSQANNLQQIIDATDKEIDKMVYALYGLTQEEIQIVEGKQ